MTNTGERIHLLICGRVQGVWYRASTAERAEELGLTGWVSNRPDGAVELMAEGGREALDHLLEWCRVGPPLAHVSKVEIKRCAPSGEFQKFHVR